MAPPYAHPMPDEAGMADAQASVPMDEVKHFIARSIGATMRFVRWSVSSAEDEPDPQVVPLPGPAHGPVPAIEFRVETQRRRAS